MEPVELRENALVVAVLRQTLPGDHEIAVGIDSNSRARLGAKRISVDAILAAACSAGGIECLRVNAEVAAILSLAAPRDDKLAVGVHGDVCIALCRRSVGIEANLASLGIA